jgi:predicted Zn-dependent peptidase
VAVVADPEATALAVAVVTPGSAWELPGTEGLTLLSAMTALEAVRPSLDSLGAHARVDCSPAVFTFSLVAGRDDWAPALRVFLDGLFRPAPGQDDLARARARLAASLDLDQASPAWQARLAVRRALHEDSLDSGWLGPACGVPETLSFFDLADVRAGAHRFAPRLAHLAALTPVASQTVARALERRIPAGPRPRIPAPRVTTAGRRYVERNTVTARLAVAFPFDAGADLEAIRLLGAVAVDAVAPGVDRPESYTAGHELIRHGEGGALVVRVVTTPAAAAEYAARIESVVRSARDGVSAPVLERVARRHRGLRLAALAQPEARAAEMALDLALGRTPVPWPVLEIAGPRLRSAAMALGAPARSVVGPRAARGAVEP